MYIPGTLVHLAMNAADEHDGCEFGKMQAALRAVFESNEGSWTTAHFIDKLWNRMPFELSSTLSREDQIRWVIRRDSGWLVGDGYGDV